MEANVTGLLSFFGGENEKKVGGGGVTMKKYSGKM